MGRVGSRKKKNTINNILVKDKLGQTDMALMHRVKCAAEDPNLLIFFYIVSIQGNYSRISPSP